jgi:hypothetical protein
MALFNLENDSILAVGFGDASEIYLLFTIKLYHNYRFVIQYPVTADGG